MRPSFPVGASGCTGEPYLIFFVHLSKKLNQIWLRLHPFLSHCCPLTKNQYAADADGEENAVDGEDVAVWEDDTHALEKDASNEEDDAADGEEDADALEDGAAAGEEDTQALEEN